MKIFLLIILLLKINTLVAQPTDSINKSTTQYFYNKPLKLVINYTNKEMPDCINYYTNMAKELGFSDTILVFKPAKYPNKAYKDSVDAVCKINKIASVLEFNFINKATSSYYCLSNIKLENTAKLTGYDYEKNTVISPIIIFDTPHINQMKRQLYKMYPLNN